MEAYHIMMLARYIIVDELEKKTAELTKALELLTQACDDTIEALGSALSLKDEETEAHSQRVTAYAISIARTVPVPTQYLPVLARAMPVEADSVWGAFTAASVAAIYGALPRGAQPPG
jgi:HD-GYP domain-containing protein (c-di-GMP phosphodiesterase class II)